MFAIALLFRPNPRTSVAQTVYVEFFPPFESITKNYIPSLPPEEFDIPLPEPSVLSRLTKALEFRRKGIPVVIRRKSEGNGRVEEAGGAAWICGGLSREADRNPFPGREGSTGAVSTMPQSGLTSRDRSRVRRSRTVRAETIVPLISPVSFVCIVPLHRLSSLSLSLSLPFSPHYEGEHRSLYVEVGPLPPRVGGEGERGWETGPRGASI